MGGVQCATGNDGGVKVAVGGEGSLWCLSSSSWEEGDGGLRDLDFFDFFESGIAEPLCFHRRFFTFLTFLPFLILFFFFVFFRFLNVPKELLLLRFWRHEFYVLLYVGLCNYSVLTFFLYKFISILFLSAVSIVSPNSLFIIESITYTPSLHFSIWSFIKLSKSFYGGWTSVYMRRFGGNLIFILVINVIFSFDIDL